MFFTILCGLDIFVTDQYFYVIIIGEWRHILVQNTPKFWYRSIGASDDNTCFSGILKFPYKCMGDVTFSDSYNSALDYNILDLITAEYSPYHGPYYIQKLHLDIYALDLYYNYKISWFYGSTNLCISWQVHAPEAVPRIYEAVCTLWKLWNLRKIIIFNSTLYFKLTLEFFGRINCDQSFIVTFLFNHFSSYTRPFTILLQNN